MSQWTQPSKGLVSLCTGHSSAWGQSRGIIARSPHTPSNVALPTRRDTELATPEFDPDLAA